MQFPVEMNIRGSKSPANCIPFHRKYDFQVRSLINKVKFLYNYFRNIICYEFKTNFNMLRYLKTDTFKHVVTYPASYA